MPTTMPANTRPSIVSYALKTLAGALACGALWAPPAQAAGLGKLTVLSALGQPLQAEIELTAVASNEAGALVARLASAEAFRGANIDFNPALASLRFAIEQRGGRQLIRISSSQAVNEPFVDMLLELSWNSGRLVREYTFLLDPPDLRQTQSAQVAAPGNGPAEVRPAPPARPAAVVPAARPEASHPAKAASDYHVKPGDTLGRIAARLKPADVSLDQMLVALYRANPDAFAGENMNRLRSGRILALPDPSVIGAAASASEARGVVIAHAADFNAYRNKLAGQVASSTAAKAPESGQSAAGKISARVEEHATPANESKDQLKLSKAAPQVAGAGSATTLTASAEDKIAKDQQIADATARVKELEKNVSDLERLMAVKAQPARPASVPTLDLNEARPVAAKAAAPVLLPKKAPLPEPTWLDLLSDNIRAIGLAAAALLAGAAALVAARRRKRRLSDRIGTGIANDPGAAAHTLFDESGGQSVDTNNSVFNSNFAPSASQLDTNEVDPVAEADVYIAYGRDAQAEEILKEALRTHPERHPVRLKLLEIYAARKDARAFETQAGQLYSLTRGSGHEWLQAAALGLSIEPHNRLYAGAPAETVAADVEPAAVLAAAGEDLDLSQALAAQAEHPGMVFDDGLGAAPAAAEVVALAVDDGLDFDLGDFSLEPLPAAAAAIELPLPPAAAAEPSFDMDFDLPFDQQLVSDAPAGVLLADDNSMDFDLDLPAQYSPAPAAVPLPAEAAPLPDPLLDLDMMHFELTAPPETVAPATFDLSGIDLDLDLGAAAAEGADDALSALRMEMDTKLDLAVAYQEIGDKEGARELIDEVIKGGSAAQMAKANVIRAQLG